jgi:sRNA-binding carbon storage regulator CsrA
MSRIKLNPREVSITRDEIYLWVLEAKAKRKGVRSYVKAKLEADERVNQHDVRISDEERRVIEYILDDLQSYL